MTEQVMTIKQVAEYLQVTKKTIYALTWQGELPGFKVGKAWRFKKEDIDRWIEMNKENSKKERPKTEANYKGDSK